MHINMMGSLIIRCAFLLLLAIDTGLAQQTDTYSQTSLLTSATPNQATPKLDTGGEDVAHVLVYVFPFVFPVIVITFWGILIILSRRAKKRNTIVVSADDQQPPLPPAPVTVHQPNQQENQLLLYSLNLRTQTTQHHLAGIERLSARVNGLITQASGRRNPSDQPSMNTNEPLKVCVDQPSNPSAGDTIGTSPPQGPPSYSDAISLPRRKQWKRRPAPPPPIPPPPYSDVTSPRQGPAPPPPIPPPSYSDVMSLPLDYRYTRDSEPGRGPTYITHM